MVHGVHDMMMLFRGNLLVAHLIWIMFAATDGPTQSANALARPSTNTDTFIETSLVLAADESAARVQRCYTAPGKTLVTANA